MESRSAIRLSGGLGMRASGQVNWCSVVYCVEGEGQADGRRARAQQTRPSNPCLKFSFKKSVQAVVLPRLCILSLSSQVSMQPVPGSIPVMQKFRCCEGGNAVTHLPDQFKLTLVACNTTQRSDRNDQYRRRNVSRAGGVASVASHIPHLTAPLQHRWWPLAPASSAGGSAPMSCAWTNIPAATAAQANTTMGAPMGPTCNSTPLRAWHCAQNLCTTQTTDETPTERDEQ